MMINNQVESFLDEMIPSPKCELDYTSDYTLLIAIILSAQTLDKRVNEVTPILFNKYPTLDDLKEADLTDLEAILKPLGLAKNKSKAIKKLAIEVTSRYNGVIPTSREELASLPGVGIKTSGVFLAEFYHQNYLPVDTHVARVAFRLGITKKNDDIKIIESKLSKFFKYKNLDKRHLQLVLFGRYICTSKCPKCDTCKFLGKCKFIR